MKKKRKTNDQIMAGKATRFDREEFEEAVDYMVGRFEGQDATIVTTGRVIRVDVGGDGPEYEVSTAFRHHAQEARGSHGEFLAKMKWRVLKDGGLAFHARSYEEAARLIEEDSGLRAEESDGIPS